MEDNIKESKSMRLRDYQQLLERCLNLLNKLSSQIVRNNSNRGLPNDLKIAGISSFNEAVLLLKECRLFQDKLNELDKMEYINRVSDDVVIDQNEYNKLKSIRDAIILQASNLKSAIESILDSEKENTINIKIPPSVSTMSELKDFINDLDVVFRVYNEISCDVSFRGVDSGSAWFVIALGAMPVAKKCIEFLFSMAKKCLELRNLKLDGDRKALEIEELKNRITEKEFKAVQAARIAENNEKYSQKRNLIAEEILKILKLEEEKVANENEVIEKVKVALDKLGELLDNGMEIKPALNAPEEIKQISANFYSALEEHKNLSIGISSQKLIEQRNNVDNSEKEPQNDAKEE